MRFVRTVLAALLIAGLLGALAGCGSAPVTFADLPVHPAVSPLERGANAMADSLAASMESSLAERGSVEIRLYRVPEDVIWEEIDGFFTESLSESDWKPADELRQESAAVNMIGWTRGSFASEQGLMIGYGPDLLGDGAFLIVALFSE